MARAINLRDLSYLTYEYNLPSVNSDDNRQQKYAIRVTAIYIIPVLLLYGRQVPTVPYRGTALLLYVCFYTRYHTPTDRAFSQDYY